LFGGIAFIPFDAYFNLFCGLLQAFVFLIISLVYWKLERTTI
jgi:F0F1-type ATP synthase membrane subunit a